MFKVGSKMEMWITSAGRWLVGTIVDESDKFLEIGDASWKVFSWDNSIRMLSVHPENSKITTIIVSKLAIMEAYTLKKKK